MATRLIIDDFEFTAFEVPDVINFGGAQSLSVHKLPGGSRIIDSMGRDDAPLEWSGVFTGKNALTRARFLDGYRVAGNIHTLTWGTFIYSVVIREYLPKYERDNHIPYRIVCEVIADLSNIVHQVADGYDLDAQIIASLDVVYTLSKSLGPSLFDEEVLPSPVTIPGSPSVFQTIAGVITATQDAIADVTTVFDGAMQGLVSVVNLEMAVISTIRNSIDYALGFIDGAEALITNGFAELNFLFSGGLTSAGGNVGDRAAYMLNAGVIATANLSTLRSTKAALVVTNRNIGYINGYPNAKKITVIGGSLVDMALQYYGDATQWPLIAIANGLTDPVITGQTTLIIPPAASTPTNIGGGGDVDHWMGSDVNLSNTNDLGTVISGTKSQQRILRRLLTNPLDYKWHTGYGAGVLQHVGDTDFNLPTIEGLIISQVRLEPGVAQSPPPSVTFDIQGDDVTANIEYTDTATNSRQFLAFTVSL